MNVINLIIVKPIYQHVMLLVRLENQSVKILIHLNILAFFLSVMWDRRCQEQRWFMIIIIYIISSNSLCCLSFRIYITILILFIQKEPLSCLIFIRLLNLILVISRCRILHQLLTVIVWLVLTIVENFNYCCSPTSTLTMNVVNTI
jgi:hypothetical protein